VLFNQDHCDSKAFTKNCGSLAHGEAILGLAKVYETEQQAFALKTTYPLRSRVTTGTLKHAVHEQVCGTV